MSETEELKPCPFCGSPAELCETKNHDYFVRCSNVNCHARTRNFHENDVGAVMAWNDRDIEDRMRQLVQGLDHCMRSTSSSSDECAGCPLQGWSTDGFQCTKSDRMRDLGIEVAQ